MKISKKALITGITGQDGSYLAELLLKKGYQVHGFVRRKTISHDPYLANLQECLEHIELHYGSISDALSLYKLLQIVKPDECYHLAGHSLVRYDFTEQDQLLKVNFHSTLYLLSAIKELVPHCKFFYAGSSEMFGSPNESPQTELTRFNPKSLYGISKVASYHAINSYRLIQGLHACVGILYNHESPRRGLHFVTRKITNSVALIKLGLQPELVLGNLDAIRDWGYAPEYMEAVWKMVQQDTPEDFILATGIGHTVNDVIQEAFEYVGLDPNKYVKTDPNFYRPSEKIPLLGDASYARQKLGWCPNHSFSKIIQEMVEHDLYVLKTNH